MSPEVKGFRGLITHLLGFAGTQHLSGLFEQVSFLWQWEIRLWWRTEALHHDKGGFDLSLESHTLPKVWVSELIIDGGISPLSKLTACCLPLKGDGLLFLNWLDRGSRIYLCNNWIPFYSLYGNPHYRTTENLVSAYTTWGAAILITTLGTFERIMRLCVGVWLSVSWRTLF